MSDGRKGRRLVRIDIALLIEWMTTGTTIHAVCEAGLPADAQFISLTHDIIHDRVLAVFESSEWDPPFEAAGHRRLEGTEYQRMDIQYRTIHEAP